MKTWSPVDVQRDHGPLFLRPSALPLETARSGAMHVIRGMEIEAVLFRTNFPISSPLIAGVNLEKEQHVHVGENTGAAGRGVLQDPPMGSLSHHLNLELLSNFEGQGIGVFQSSPKRTISPRCSGGEDTPVGRRRKGPILPLSWHRLTRWASSS